MQYFNDFGFSNVFVKNVKNYTTQNSFTSPEEIKDKFNHIKVMLDQAERECLAIYEKNRCCEHTFGKPTFSVRKNLFKFYYMFQRSCLVCGYTEHARADELEGAPDWAKNASQTYYNNDI